MPKLPTILGLVAISVAGLAISYRLLAPGVSPDTSRAAADRIRPGMTLAEAEQIIGAPPGDYRRGGGQEPQFITGNRWPRVIRWTTSQGCIEVVDGEWGIQKGDRLESWSTGDGIIDSVRWSPVEPKAAR